MLDRSWSIILLFGLHTLLKIFKHSAHVQSTLTFGCLNVRSLLNKFDDIIELCRDHHIDLLCLTETWHDADSAVLGRLRCNGYNVVDRPRPRAVGADDLSVNHGGVLVMASADISLSPIAVPDQPSTFQMVCVRAVAEQFSAIVVAVYRPGSVAVQQSFHDELASVLDRVAVYQEPIYVVGDVNIRLDRDDDPHADQLRLLVDCYGLVLHSTGRTHQLGGTLDAVITHNTTGCPSQVVTTSGSQTIFYYSGRSMRRALSDPPCLSAPAHGVA